MNKGREHIAYAGSAYTIEWYFNAQGKSQALDYYCSLSDTERISILKLFRRMGDHGEIKNKSKFRYEGDKIYAFKPQPDRYLCFFYDGKKIVVTNAFRKKQQKLPPREKERGLKVRADYISRVNEGDYYD